MRSISTRKTPPPDAVEDHYWRRVIIPERMLQQAIYMADDSHGDFKRARAAAAQRRSRPTEDGPVILVVDDERPNLKLAEIVLGAAGFIVKTATDAISAFEVLKNVDPALIVMDIQLPGMDGWELTRRLKRNVVTSHIPIIALTAYSAKGDEERALAAGCVAYFAKPVSTRDLPDIIKRYLPSKT